MRTKDIVIGADYLVDTWRRKGRKANVSSIRRSAHGHPSIVVTFLDSDGEERTDAIAPASVLRPWDERLEAQHQERLAHEREARELKERIEGALDVTRVHVALGGEVTIYLTREQIEALL